MHGFKLTEDTCVYGFMPYCGDERQCYCLVAKKDASRQFVVLEHIGNDFALAAGSFLGRVVAMGRDHEAVRLGLLQGKKMLEKTLSQNRFEPGGNRGGAQTNTGESKQTQWATNR